MQLDNDTAIRLLQLAGAAAVGIGAWVLRIEKRTNGLRELHGRLDKVDRRTERMSYLQFGRDLADDPGEETVTR